MDIFLRFGPVFLRLAVGGLGWGGTRRATAQITARTRHCPYRVEGDRSHATRRVPADPEPRFGRPETVEKRDSGAEFVFCIFKVF